MISTTSLKSIRSQRIILIVGIIVIACNLRPAITSVGPIISIIREDTGISNSAAGLLTTLPLLGFAVFSILSPKLSQYIGIYPAVFIGIVTLGTGTFIRSADFLAALFTGTALAGIGIAICNVLLPGIVKQEFPRKVGLMTGVYTLSMGVFASTGSGISYPLTELGLDWENALAIWGIPAGIALIIWLPQLRLSHEGAGQQSAGTVSKSPLWRSPLAWKVTLFMGMQSFLFYCLVAWLPEILQTKNLSVGLSGWMLSIMQIVGVPLSFLTPVLADRFQNQRGIIAVLCTVYMTGLIGVQVSSQFLWLCFFVVLLGFGQGSAISLSLTLLSLRAANPLDASRLSGMAQSFGYLFAAAGPLLMGLLFDIYGTWTPALFIFIAVSAGMLFVGLGAGRAEYVQSYTHN
ncbi:CynX/NimT family MFS transporter [Alteribacillus sp. HJP-4]|uniref:CynX/NimT family MFS transporter n=1 Tax=Alteribacillus sp. HJP-4 TaxID=2775394 RepID=UPI0035CD0713